MRSSFFTANLCIMKIQSIAFHFLVLVSMICLSSCQTEEKVLPIFDDSLLFNERVVGTFSGNILYDGEEFDQPELGYTVKVVESVANSDAILINGERFELYAVDYPDHDFVRFIRNTENPAYVAFTFANTAMKFEWESVSKSAVGNLYLR